MPGAAVGVGPWPGGPAEWPADPRYDPELLAHGDRRNVVDAYRYWRREAVAADLARRAHPFHVAIENFGHDANIGTVVRTANAFAAAAVHVVGRRRWNRRGAMVTDRYQTVHHHVDVAGLAAFAAAHGLAVVAVDNTPGAVRLETAALPRACVLALRPGGPGPDRRRAGGRGPDGVGRPVRLHPLGQRRGGGRDRHARVDPGARRSVRRVVAPAGRCAGMPGSGHVDGVATLCVSRGSRDTGVPRASARPAVSDALARRGALWRRGRWSAGAAWRRRA